ncbi:hypothetical protein V8C42DRAFT_322658 [Trichoderma barbatum]
MEGVRSKKATNKPSLETPSQSRRDRPNVVTDARKHQNRVAAKIYREKRKRRLEFLEQQLISQSRPSIPEIVPNVPIIPTGAESMSATQAELSWHQESQPIPTQEFAPADWTYYVNTTLSGNHVPCNDTRNLHHESHLHSASSAGSTLYTPNFGGSEFYSQSYATFGSLNTAAPSLPASSQGTDFGDRLAYTTSPLHAGYLSEGSQMYSSTNSTQWRSPPIIIKSSGSGLSIESSLPCLHHPPVTSCQRLVTLFSQLKVEQRRALLSIADTKRLRLTDVLRSLANSANNISVKEHVNYEHLLKYTTSTLPSLQLNNFRITQASFWSAIRANAQVLGFELENYVHEEAISPVSVQSASFINGEATEHFSTVPRELRPLKMQIEKEHHVYLDVLPFPKFREQILIAVSHDPPLFDEEELCIDLTNDGLVCWGSHTGGGSIDACMPWDSRSWEPQPWFLRKYWFLVGGQDDEMWSCTKWWRRTRGEIIL